MKTLTMRGKTLDMGALAAKHSTMRALGNANMNARGDVLDQNGKIIRKREDIAAQYHESNPQNVRTVGIKNLTGELFTPEAAVAHARAKAALPPAAPPAQAVVQPKKQRKLLDHPDGGV